MNYKKNKKFHFDNVELFYDIRLKNGVFKNERTIEIPILKYFLEKTPKESRILEVGCVLKQYYKIKKKWDVLDKFEFGEGIINEDVVNFKSKNKYDLIFSISTMEHVGFDEEDKDDNKFEKSIQNLKENCLKKQGSLIITFPLGYNHKMDKVIFNKKIKFVKEYYMKRTSKKNEWEQVSLNEIKNVEYGKPFNNANAIFIGIIKK